jgi:hypothetical protein
MFTLSNTMQNGSEIVNIQTTKVNHLVFRNERVRTLLHQSTHKHTQAYAGGDTHACLYCALNRLLLLSSLATSIVVRLF